MPGFRRSMARHGHAWVPLASGNFTQDSGEQAMRELLERSVGASVRLVFDLADDAWPVMADANQLQTALLNLAINARDAMPGGGTLRIGCGNITVQIAETDMPEGEYAVLSVQDNGTGMTVAVVARPLLGLDADTALLLGAVVASTDAAAIFAALRHVSIPERVRSVLEVESGLNDPMAAC